jgi:hypothetical protein
MKKPLPDKVMKSAAALVSCVAGAVLIDQTINMAKQAGLKNIEVTEKAYNIDVMTDCHDPLYREAKEFLPDGAKLSDYIVSVDITANRQ